MGYTDQLSLNEMGLNICCHVCKGGGEARDIFTQEEREMEAVGEKAVKEAGRAWKRLEDAG